MTIDALPLTMRRLDQARGSGVTSGFVRGCWGLGQTRRALRAGRFMDITSITTKQSTRLHNNRHHSYFFLSQYCSTVSLENQALSLMDPSFWKSCFKKLMLCECVFAPSEPAVHLVMECRLKILSCTRVFTDATQKCPHHHLVTVYKTCTKQPHTNNPMILFLWITAGLQCSHRILHNHTNVKIWHKLFPYSTLPLWAECRPETV